MAIRFEGPALGPGSWVPARRARRLTKGTRALYAASLIVLAITSLYISATFLARVTPALFPGQTLSSVLPGPIPTKSILPEPGASSVFNRRINILVMGLDTRPQQENDLTLRLEERYNARTDTLMVASIDPVTSSINFLSFPRDLVITIHPEDSLPYENRINESFYDGLQAGRSVEAGAEQVQRDLKENFGVETDYWVILDFRGVARMVDELGGIQVDVPPELAIDGWWYSDDDVTHEYISIPAGPQQLDGYLAVAFGRNREPSDLARIERQQLVLEAATREVFAQGLLSPGRWPGLWNAYKSSVKTNIPTARLPGYANLARETQGRMTTYSIGDPVGEEATVWDGYLHGAAVLFWDPENVRYWIARTFPPAEYANAVVEVQDGRSAPNDLEALAIGRHFEFEMAIPKVYVGPPTDEVLETEILVFGGDGRRKLAEDIARELRVNSASIREMPRENDSLPDVRVILGPDVTVPTKDEAPPVSAGG